MVDIFVSSASEDVERVKPLVSALQENGWSVWWSRDLVAGPSYDEKIEEALDAASCVVVVWSETSIRSTWVRTEANEGLERGVLVPLLIEDVKPPLAFRIAQTAKMFKWPDQPGELEDAIDGIAALLGRSTPTEHATESKSIAVLPFTNISNDPDQEFFCDGISEELINALVALRDLDVIARTSSFQFKNRNEDVRKVAMELGVSHVLAGSVRKAGNRVRITAQLINGRDGKHLWSNQYDRDLTDIFVVQDEIAAAITAALTSELIPTSGHIGTSNPLAFDAYLRARHELAAVIIYPVAPLALPHIQEALELDPQFADAWGSFAVIQYRLGFHKPDFDELHHGIERALELDPHQSSALQVKATLRFCEDYDAQGALDALAVIIRQRPSDYDALESFAWICAYLDQDVVDLATRLIALDPLREVAYRIRSDVHGLFERQEESLADARRALELGPDDLHMHETMILYAHEHGNLPVFDDALKKYRALVSPDSFLAEAFAAKDRDATIKLLKGRERPGGNMRTLDMARAYAYLGDHETAIDKFSEYVSISRSFLRVNFARNTLLQPLLKYPEYQKILASIGCDDSTVARLRVPAII